MTNNILRKLQHLYVIIYLISLLIIGEILLKWINEWNDTCSNTFGQTVVSMKNQKQQF